MADTDLTAYLESNPKMIGVLFTLFLLLAQASSAVAGGAGAIQGP
jgi:hypothetical protein